MLTWTEHEVALFPGPAETAPYDATACFSGCAVEHDGGVPILYTGVLGDARPPCLARAADDGLSGFVKGPVTPFRPASAAADITEFRDHSVWQEDGGWQMLVAGARHEHGGSVFERSSADPRSWHYDGVFAGRADARVPVAVWECPDCFTSGDAADAGPRTGRSPTCGNLMIPATVPTEATFDRGNLADESLPVHAWDDEGEPLVLGAG